MTLHIATLGDGAMATVCSMIAAAKSTPDAPIEIRAWSRGGGRDAARVAAFNAARENTRYLPGIKLPPNLLFTTDDRALFDNASLILCAVPTQYIRPTLLRLRPHVPPNVPVVSVAKGIENSTLKRPSEIILELLGDGSGRAVAALSGPSIAGELARGLPATMVTASIDATGTHGIDAEDLSRRIQELFTNSFLRVYTNDDLLGVELAGALKNVIAVAAGILDGMHAGNNAKAALLTRGLVEITRLGTALGAQADTFTGLAGMGDLVTTCVSPEGRNRSFGQRVGQGEKPADVLASMVGVVEGVPTCKSVVELARKLHIDMPISQGLHAVLFENRDPRKAIATLMSRELKSESE
jgi:glycerol-3-phosphate dehydrogenase (NAD(P)+)